MFKIASTGQGCFFSLLAVALFGCGTPDEELDLAQLNQRQELIAESDRLAESSASDGPEIDPSSVSIYIQADTFEIAKLDPGASRDQTGSLAVICTISAQTPTWENGETHGWGSAVCPNSPRVTGEIGLERSDGTSVGTPARATKTAGSTRVHWERRAAGCNPALSYQSVFTGNGVTVRSGWTRGCS